MAHLTDEEVFCRTCDRTHRRYECPADPFGAPETITVADLAAGDFVIALPAHNNVRGARVNSGVREITEAAYGRWRQRGRGGRMLLSRRFTFHDRDQAPLDVPCDHPVIVRRPQGR
jgi:hypothetical protein